ncbi:MAG: butyrate kinase [Spirochaetes bacterium]|nr:butyrate kinase [Spirochaetota bacterium]
MSGTGTREGENRKRNVYRILVINPGSTSTKLAMFENDDRAAYRSESHSSEDLRRYGTIFGQVEFRLGVVERFLSDHGIDIKLLDAVVGRGGLLKPVTGGVYEVNDLILSDLETCRYGEHASNLGGLLSHLIARKAGCGAYIVDPVVVDEMEEVARISGMPEIERRSIFHALNHKSSAREVAAIVGKSYEECNFIVAHMGGGISVAAHCKGRVIDVNNCLDGDGPFSPERSGGLPAGSLLELSFSREYTYDELKRKITGRGGLIAYRGTNSFKDFKKAVEKNDHRARLLYRAMAYQVSQEIAKHGATLKGKVDRIILTGNMALDEQFVGLIEERVRYLAPVSIVPGEREMRSLSGGVLLLLRGEEKKKVYV